MILSAAYALWLYRRVVMGDLIKESLKSITDMTRAKRAIFAPLIVMTILLLGVYPSLGDGCDRAFGGMTCYRGYRDRRGGIQRDKPVAEAGGN